MVKTFAVKDQAQKEAARASLFATDGTGEIFEGFVRHLQQTTMPEFAVPPPAIATMNAYTHTERHRSPRLRFAQKRIERLIPADGHMVGGSMTLADAWLFALVNQFRAGWSAWLPTRIGRLHPRPPADDRTALLAVDGVPVDGWMDKLPKLQAVVRTVAANPGVRAYYDGLAETALNGRKLYEVHAGRK